MKEYLISNIKNNYFSLKDTKNNNEEELLFIFYSGDKPKIRDTIKIDERLLDKRSEFFAQPFCYEFLGEENEIIKNYINKQPTEYIILKTQDKNIIYKRIYG